MRALALLLAAAASVSLPDPVVFPGAVAARDPSGRYVVYRAAPDESAPGGGRNRLVLLVQKSGVTQPLLSYGRSAAVFWAPDGNALAVTDRRSPGVSTAFVFFPERPTPVDLDAELDRALGPLPERRDNGHVALEVVRWLNAKTLRVRLRGYGVHDPEGFDELFDYELGGRFRRAASVVAPHSP